MSAARSVGATFNAASTTAYTLTVSKAGTGSGTISSSPAGITCGTDCSQSYASGAAVTLSATPASGSTFGGWSGACTGTGACTVTMSAVRSVGATFSAAGAQAVAWTAVVGATWSGSTLSKTAASGWGNSGGVSTQRISSGSGYVEVTATDTLTHRSMFGLSRGNTDAGYPDIDFAIYQRYGYLHIYEGGTYMLAGPAYAVGDKLRVSVASGVVKFSRNGTVFYTSRKVAAYPLLLDAAIYTQGSKLGSATISIP